MNEPIPQLHNHEWLSNFIRRARLTPFVTATLLAIIDFLFSFALAVYFHTWSSVATSRGLSADLSGLVFYALAQPSIFGYLCWLQSSGQQLFGQMASEGALEASKDLRTVLFKCRDSLQSKWVSRIAGTLSLAFFVWQIIVYSNYPDNLAWITSHPAIVWFRSPVDALAFYALIIVLYDLVVIFIALNGLYKVRLVKVQPFHPDNAGGLGAIGRFTANLSYCIAVIGIALSMTIIQDPVSIITLTNFGAIIMFVCYLLLAPTTFIVPLWSSHLAMINYRDMLIKETAKELDIAFTKMRTRRSDRLDRRELLMKRIQVLENERNLIYKFPTWPFNSQNIKKFFGIALSPLVPTITSVIIDLFAKLI